MEHNKLRAPLEAEEVENNWAISYGDMITLLLGFFVLFFNIESETMNLNLIKKDIDEYFKSAEGQVNRSLAQVQEIKSQKTPPIITTDISNTLQIKSNIEGERILVEFPGVSFFKSASHELTSQGKEALGDFAKAIDQHLGLFRLVVRGYTDALPLNPNSRYKDNLELSAFRSISAIRHMASLGVNLENMRIAGYGESSINRAEKDIDHLKNQRKVVIVIEPLDHTERVASQAGEGVAPDAIGIEESLGAEVPGREPSSKEPQKLMAELLEKAKHQLHKIEEIKILAHDQVTDLGRSLEKNSLYQKVVQYFVESNLASKGYSKKEIESMIRNNENKKEVNK